MHEDCELDDHSATNFQQPADSQNSRQCHSEVHDASVTGSGESRTSNREFKILYLFSGPKRGLDSVESFCKKYDMTCECIDIEYNPEHDLLCQDVWNALLRRIDDFDAYLLSPPCSSFTMARSG